MYWVDWIITVVPVTIILFLAVYRRQFAGRLLPDLDTLNGFITGHFSTFAVLGWV